MNTILKSILLGAMVLCASSTLAFAQRVAPPSIPTPPPPTTIPDPGTPPGDPGTPPDPGNPSSGGCTSICGSDEDFTPKVKVVFKINGKSKPQIASHLGCGEKLAALGDFRKDELAAVAAPQNVRIVPVCPYVTLTSDDPLVLLHAVGNAQGLERTITANVLTAAALEERGYRPADVVALGFAKGKETLILYVHKL